MSYKEREPRKLVTLEVHLKDFSLTKTTDESSLNMSRGGAFIQMETPFPDGTLLKFEIDVPGEKTIAGAARVAWRREVQSDDGPPGIGVKFLKMNDESRSLLDEILGKAEVQLVAKRPESPAEAEAEKPAAEAEKPEPAEEESRAEEEPRPEEKPEVEAEKPEATEEEKPEAAEAEKPEAEAEKPEAEAEKPEPEAEKPEPDEKPEPEQEKSELDTGEKPIDLQPSRADAGKSEPEIDPGDKTEPKRLSPIVWVIGVIIVIAIIWVATTRKKDGDSVEQKVEAPAPPKTSFRDGEKIISTAIKKQLESTPSAEKAEAAADKIPSEADEAEKSSAGEAPAEEAAEEAPAEEAAEEAPAGEAAEEAPAEEAPAEEAVEEAAPKAIPADRLATVDVITTPEGAAVTVDGVAQPGVTPMTVDVERGKKIEITARLAGFVSRKEKFTARKKTAELSLKLKPVRLKFRMNSKPKGTRIIIDGKWNGNTPYTFIRMKYKPLFEFKLEKKGYQSIEGQITEKDWVEEGRFYIFTFNEPLKRAE